MRGTLLIWLGKADSLDTCNIHNPVLIYPCGGFVRPKIARTHKVAGSLKAELIADISIEASSVATGDCFNRVNYCHIHLVSSVSSFTMEDWQSGNAAVC